MTKLYYKLFAFTLLLLTGANSTMAQEFNWAKRIGYPKAFTTNLTTDKEGNVYVAGDSYGTNTFDMNFDSKVNSVKDGLYIIKYDSTGRVIWFRDIADRLTEDNTRSEIRSMAIDKQDNLWITGSFSGNFIFKGILKKDTVFSEQNSFSFFIAKYSKEGEPLWIKYISDPNSRLFATELALDVNGNAYVAGTYEGNIIFSEDFVLAPSSGGYIGDFFIAKYSNDGAVMWVKPAGGVQLSESVKLAIDIAGDPYIAATFNHKAYFGGGNEPVDTTLETGKEYNTFLAKFNKTGSFVWVKVIGSGNYNAEGYAIIKAIAADFTGQVYVTGYHGAAISFKRVNAPDTLLPTKTHFLGKYTNEGKVTWVTGYNAQERGEAFAGSFCTGLAIDKSNNIYLSGDFYPSITFNKDKANELTLYSDGFNSEDICVAKFSDKGHFLWALKAGSEHFDYSTDITVNDYGKVFVTGTNYRNKPIAFGNITLPFDPDCFEYDLSGFICAIRDNDFKVDTNTYNTVRGKVFIDKNKDCLNNEEGIKNIIIKAEPGPFYSSTDSLGNYILYVGKGNYIISQILTNLKGQVITQTCPNGFSYTHNFDSLGSTVSGLDFGNQVTYKPYLTVDIAADRRRRCFRSTTTVNYRNEGYASANNVQVKVILPEYVVPISSSVPWSSRNDSLLIFDIGTLEAGASKTITIIDSVICSNESIRNLTQCTKAIITPFNEDETDHRWDQSSVGLEAICKDNGLVRVSIKNTGIGHMADSAAYRIYLDAVQVFAANYKLQSGDSLLLEIPVNGKTIRVEADVRPYHPGKGQPSITLEGCGSASKVSISKGFVDLLPQDDAEEEIEISCMPILDSYDPNDKMASPAGITASHIITAQNELEYIIRFQNTGNDVAYTITIEDVLDEHLDIATLQIGASSHPCTWKVTGEGLPKLIWTFSNINLPDSTTNEPGSHGFVKFTIAQKANNPHGTKIRNKADIYFDYNSAITTNETLHTIGELLVSSEKAIVNNCGLDHPSPAQAGADIVLQDLAQVKLQAISPVKGFGTWKVIRGSGIVSDITSASASITELAIGENIFEWSVSLCDEIVRDSIRVERVVIPVTPIVSNPAPYCVDEPIQAISATGNNITWYADAALTLALAEGNSYQPTAASTDTVYVTQKSNGYESPAKVVIVKVKPVPTLPEIESLAYTCAGRLLQPLWAKGENITWYRDAELKNKMAEGNMLPQQPINTDVIYVTQQREGCESAAAKVTVKPGGIEYDKIWVANVITPNGDTKNDAFTQPVFPEGICIGDFLGIQIYNRWGKLIYESKDANFAWGPKDQSNGVYFFSMHYTNFSYRGSLTILH